MRWPFRGRQTELRRVLDLVGDGARLVTITGMAGVGKSALAEEAMHRLGEHASIALDPHDREAAGRAVAATRRPGGRHLAVIEVSPSEPGAAAGIEELLARTPELTLIAVSRSPIGLALERPVLLEPFDEPTARLGAETDGDWLVRNPGVAMFLDRIEAISRDPESGRASLGVVVELCRRLQGLPLAIHIAALNSRMLPLPAMLDEMTQPLDFLRVGYSDTPDPASSLRASIELGFDSIDDEGLELISAIAQFPAGCSLLTLKSAGPVGTADRRRNLMPTVASLVHRGLLVARSYGDGSMTRFELPPFYREYLLEAQPPAPAELVRALRSATIAQCLQVAHVRGPAWDRARALFDAEEANLLAFIQADRMDQRIDDAAEIVDVIYRFWIHRGRVSEGLGVVASLDRDGLDVVTRARLALATASMRALHMSYTSAYDDFARAVNWWRSSGQRVRLAGALVAFAPAAFEVDGWEAAEAALAEAIDIYRDLEDEWSLARAQTQLGALAVDVPGKAEFARATLQDASSTLQAVGDAGFASLPLEHLGRLLLEDGEFDQARLVLKRGLDEIRPINDQFHVSAYMNLLGLCEIALGNPLSAVERFLGSLRIAIELELKGRAVWCLEGLSDSLLALDAPEASRLCVAYALELREQLGLNEWAEFCSPRRSIRLERDDMVRSVSMALTGAAAWPPTPVVDAVTRVIGEATTRQSDADTVTDRPDGLTAREVEILGLIASGMTSRAIATRLFISIDTVGRHITNLYRKIGARGRADATMYALQAGIAGPAPSAETSAPVTPWAGRTPAPTAARR